jgi:hypothetical protein
LIVKDIENYGLLKITEKGKKYMVNPYPIMAIKPVTEEDEDDDEAVDAVAGNVEDAFDTDGVFRRLGRRGSGSLRLGGSGRRIFFIHTNTGELDTAWA